MTASSITLAGRRAAEATMVSLCVVRRPGAVVTDPVTGVVAPSFVDAYAGVCRVQSTDIGSAEVMVGAHLSSLWDAKVYFPAGSGLRIDDVCEVTLSPLNPDEVGKHYRLKERQVGTHKTADRWNAELVVK